MEGSIPSGSHEYMDTLDSHPGVAPPCHQRPVPRAPTPAEQGRKRTMQFLQEAAAPEPKSRRLEIVSQLAKLEKERAQVMERVRKRKQRLAQQIKELEADETRRAEIDDSIRRLKCETVNVD
jgi:hypothetical protein